METGAYTTKSFTTSMMILKKTNDKVMKKDYIMLK
jgi:hypothetical protein